MNAFAASPSARLAAASLAACLLLSACSGVETRLRRARHDVDVGMSKGEVLRKLGRPAATVAIGEAAAERWQYRFHDWTGRLAFTTLKVLVTVAAMAAVVVVVGAIACLCSQGKSSFGDFFGEGLKGLGHFGDGPGGSEDSEDFHRSLWILFGDDGRVAEVKAR